jgi:hypothetical protein
MNMNPLCLDNYFDSDINTTYFVEGEDLHGLAMEKHAPILGFKTCNYFM